MARLTRFQRNEKRRKDAHLKDQAQGRIAGRRRSRRRGAKLRATQREYKLATTKHDNGYVTYPEVDEMRKRYPETQFISTNIVKVAVIDAEGCLPTAANVLRDRGFDIAEYKTPQN